MIKKINWKQPKYILPAIAFPILLFIGYQVCKLFEGTEVVDTSVKTEYVNTDLPEINQHNTALKSKYDAMLEGYGKVTDYTAVEGTDREEKKQQLQAEMLYSDEEKRRIDSISAAQQKQAEDLKRMLEEQKRSMQNDRNVVSRQQAEAERRVRDNEEMDALARRMQIIQQATSGQPVMTEEDKRLKRLQELEAKERKRIQDSIALANAPLAVNKAGMAGEQHFNTVVEQENDPQLIKARVDELVKVKDGSRIRIRLSEDVEIEGEILKKGSYLYATVGGFSAQRVMANVTSVMLGGRICKVDLSVYDLDCMEGFYVPESNFRELAKNIGSSAMNMNMNINGGAEQNLESMAMQTLQQAMTATTSAISGNIRQNKAKIKFNTEVYLVDNSKQ